MDTELWKLDLDTLKVLYVQESQALAEALLQGVEWSALAEKCKQITRISIIIARKAEGLNEPPEY